MKPDAGVVADAQDVDAAEVSVVTYPPATLGDDAVSAKKWASASAPSTVHWAYDGTDRGEIIGVSCTAGGSPGSTLVLVVAVGAVVRRRRRARP